MSADDNAAAAGGRSQVAALATETDGEPPFAQPQAEKIFPIGPEKALEAMRQDVESREGRSPVAVALRHCFKHQLAVPDWLQGAFLALFDGLQRAEFESWDAAIGAWWPEGTRFDDVRGQIALEELIPAALWEMFLAKPNRAINDRLFEQVGARAGINRSGATVMRHYGRLVREGRALPPSALREAARAAAHMHDTPIELQAKSAA